MARVFSEFALNGGERFLNSAAYKVAGLTALSHLSKLIIGLLILKQLALVQGPQGMGLLGNFMSLVAMATTLAGGGVISGIIKYLAEYNDNPRRQQQFIQSAFAYVLLFSILTLMLGYSRLDVITHYVFGDSQYREYMAYFLVAQFFIAFNNFAFGVANGLGKNKYYAMMIVVGNMVAMVVASVAIQAYGFTGAVIAIMAPAVLPFIPALVYSIKAGFFNGWQFKQFLQDANLLSRYSVMLFTTAVCFPVVEIMVRNRIIATIGVDAAGYWQGVTRLSLAYLSFFSLFLSFYLLPLLSAAKEKSPEIPAAVWQVFLGICGVFLVMVGVFVCAKDSIIRLALSKDFLPISHWMVLQMVGDFFRVLSWIVGIFLIAKARTTVYIMTEILQGALFLGLSYGLMAYYASLEGVMVAYLVTYIFYCVAAWGILVYWYRTKHKRILIPNESNCCSNLL